MKKADVVLIGGGIMSATLGALLHELQPDWQIDVFERLDDVVKESTDAWHNAGTGHSAFCELNYTPQLPDGTIRIEKAITVAESFETSKQFWAYLVAKKKLPAPSVFINSVAHMSWVTEKDVSFLKKRYEAMRNHIFFSEMEYTESPQTLSSWIPLMMEGRRDTQKMAATRMGLGTDVNFGALTEKLFASITTAGNVSVYTQHEVIDVRKTAIGWKVLVEDKKTKQKKEVEATFVFIGAGGGALHLLQKSGIVEGKKYGGFPVSGRWLICNNREIINKHNAKVYGKAPIGAPPISVPHLDTRMINGKKELLFGPFAGFTTKFMKHGSYLDFPRSFRPSNFFTMVSAGLHNIPLTMYLINQVMLLPKERMRVLREFLPTANMEDWELSIAGQRVQVIKYVPGKGGVLEFGTEVVHAPDGSLAALLGASPGASVSVSIMLDLLNKCFEKQMKTASWQKKLKEMIPSFGKKMGEDKILCKEVREYTSKVLGLTSN